MVVDGGPSMTYRRWQQRSEAMARGLAAEGVRPGDRVALRFDNARWTDYAAAYVAAHKAGAAAVPLSTRFAGPELADVLDHAEPVVVVSPTDLAPAAGQRRVVEPEELERAGTAGADPPPVRSEAAAGDELAEIIYTSGTTGSPKGVACSHESILVHDLPTEAPAQPVAFAHAFPIGTNAGQECLRMPLRRTATAVVLPEFDPHRLCALIAERGIQRLQLVPAMAQMLVMSGAVGQYDVSSVERIILSSAPVPPELLAQLAEAFPQAELWNAYALTESGSARTVMRFDPTRPGAVGRPVGQSEVRVVDDDGRDLPPGETGEVWLRREGAPKRAYYRDPDSTAAAFAGDWLKTGDLGQFDADGYLYLIDRKKDLIVSGGLNISSVEVENALYAHPAVREAAVFGVPHAVLGQDVAAAVVADPAPTVRALQSFVRERLGEHKVPRRVELVERLPRTESGKVLKRELREQLSEQVAADAPQPPRTDVEATVARVWQEVLAVEQVGAHSDFFELGGHSLGAAQVMARLEDAYDTELPVTALFEHPTVAELAAVVEDAVARVG